MSGKQEGGEEGEGDVVVVERVGAVVRTALARTKEHLSMKPGLGLSKIQTWPVTWALRDPLVSRLVLSMKYTTSDLACSSQSARAKPCTRQSN